MADKRITELTNERLILGDGDYTIVDSNEGTYKYKLKRIVDSIPAPDTTLSIAGRAADAKATGDEIADVKRDLSAVANVTQGTACLEFVRGTLYNGTALTTESFEQIVMPNYVSFPYEIVISVKSGYRYRMQRKLATGDTEDEYGDMTQYSNVTTGELTIPAGALFRLNVRKDGSTYNVPCNISELQFAIGFSNNYVQNLYDTRIYDFNPTQINSDVYNKSLSDYPSGKTTIEKIGTGSGTSVFPAKAGYLYTVKLWDNLTSYQKFIGFNQQGIWVRGFSGTGNPYEWNKIPNEAELLRDTSERTAKRHQRVPVITIIDDDGSVDFYTKMFPIATQYGIPICQAVCTYYVGGNDGREVGDYISWAQIDEMHRAGHEFLVHSWKHKNYTTLSDVEIKAEMFNAINDFNLHNIYPRGISYPNGGSNTKVRRYASQFFDMGFSQYAPNQEFRANTGFIPSYFIARPTLGSYFDKTGTIGDINVVNPSDEPTTDEYIYTNSLDYYKLLVDECVDTNGWLVLCMHSWNTSNEQYALFEQTIQYALSKNVIFLTASDAYDAFKNAYESGDYIGYWNDTYDPYTGIGGHGIAVDQDGNIDIPANKYDSTITEWNWDKFPNNRISIYRMYDSTLTKIPEMSGIIEVHKTLDPTYSFEMFYPTLTHNVYQRKFSSNGVPQTWVKIALAIT